VADQSEAAVIDRLVHALDKAKCHRLLGDMCASLALRLMDRARMHWALADVQLTDAESCMRTVAATLTESRP
jgi:hypothetical protein